MATKPLKGIVFPGLEDTYIIPEEIVPEPSASDNGKFLRVVDGVPAWSAVPSAEETEF